MDARVGDRITILSNKVGAVPRSGTVVDCLGGAGSNHYCVRWDDGHETVLTPGSDAVVEHRQDAVATPEPTRVTTTVDLHFEEDDQRTEAVATLASSAGTFTGRGTARRNPVDVNLPLVGEELAAARALMDLAEALRRAAVDPGHAEQTEAHLTAR